MENAVDYGWWLPKMASANGGDVDLLINIVHVFMAVLFVGWGVFMTYCLVRFRRRPGRQADYNLVKAKPTKYLEVIVVLIEVVLLVGLSIPAVARAKNEFPSRDESFKVRVIAQQFAWNVHYAGPDGVYGSAKPEFVDETLNPIGLDPGDPAGADDITDINNLHVPLDTPTIVTLTSKDVIHCFSLNVMRVKQDVIPGMAIDVWFVPTEAGVYDIQCAQLCGINHYSMIGRLHVQSEDELAAWLAAQSEEEDSYGDEDEFSEEEEGFEE